jgi:hypothetical protein
MDEDEDNDITPIYLHCVSLRLSHDDFRVRVRLLDQRISFQVDEQRPDTKIRTTSVKLCF